MWGVETWAEVRTKVSGKDLEAGTQRERGEVFSNYIVKKNLHCQKVQKEPQDSGSTAGDARLWAGFV